jgi:16S rRNA (cytosine1402-N4)-methyltransferase
MAWLPPHATSLIDGTLGHGGHAIWLCEFLLNHPAYDGKQEGTFHVVGVDRDPAMLKKAHDRLDESWYSKLMHYYRWSYAELGGITQDLPDGKADAILLDIGVNMEHYKDGERWFSLAMHAPLDMRFCRDEWIPAHEWLMQASYEDLSAMLRQWTDYGERLRQTLVDSFIHERKRKPFFYTSDLVSRAAQYGLFAKRLGVLFQAIRIVVNTELQQLETFLSLFPEYLHPGWRVLIISYHSGEDRMVKQSFKQREDRGVWRSCTKHVVTPDRQEVVRNKAARSAKMRIFELLPSASTHE